MIGVVVPTTTEEQDMILAKEIESLTENELFQPVPLLAWLENKGNEQTFELILKQRSYHKK